jgi:4-hydroxy-2-oxoheptanedioate aldolase
LQTANRERSVIVQIEDPQPLDELDEIAALEGIDMLFFGPSDFSHPQVLAARKRGADVCREKGKLAGTVSNSGNAAELMEMGYSFLDIGADVIGLGNHCSEMFSQLNNAAQNAAQSTSSTKTETEEQ